MPIWLQVVLGVWGAFVPVIAALWKWAKGLTDRIGAISQWFDPNSALGQLHGTLPAQVQDLRTELGHLKDKERIVERIAVVEKKVEDVEKAVLGLEKAVKSK